MFNICLYSVIPMDCQLFCLVASQILPTEVTVCKIRSTLMCKGRGSQGCVAEIINLEQAGQSVLF